MEQTTFTREQIREHANSVFEEVLDGYGEFLGYLKCRWEDEKEYEDWKDYEKAIREKLAGYNIVKVIKVGAVIRTQYIDIEIKMNLASVKYKVVKLHNVKIAA